MSLWRAVRCPAMSHPPITNSPGSCPISAVGLIELDLHNGEDNLICSSGMAMSIVYHKCMEAYNSPSSRPLQSALLAALQSGIYTGWILSDNNLLFRFTFMVKDLARVQQPVRVEGPLDAPHHINCTRAEFFAERALLTQPDAMLALDKVSHNAPDNWISG